MTSNINCSAHITTTHLIFHHWINIRQHYYTTMVKAKDAILSEAQSKAANNFLFWCCHTVWNCRLYN